MKNSTINIIFILTLVYFLAGCTNINPQQQTIYHAPKQKISKETKIVKNYQLNDIKTAFVGDIVIEQGEWEIINIQTETKTEYLDRYVKALTDISFSPYYPSIKADSKRVAYLNNDKTYSIPYLNLSGQKVGNLKVAKNGKILNIDGPGLTAWSKAELPKTLVNKKVFEIIDNSESERMVTEGSKKIEGFSFQLIYTGIDNNNQNIRLTYKEFINDMIRPAFSERFSYSINEKFIRFKNIRIEVLTASSEYLKYKVIED